MRVKSLALLLLLSTVASPITFRRQVSIAGTQPARETPLAQSQSIPLPLDVLGFTPGDDRKLASWAQVIQYFKALDKVSERVRFEELGD